MRELLSRVDPSLWSEVSGVLFGISFLILVVYVFRPAKSETYLRFAELPLDSD